MISMSHEKVSSQLLFAQRGFTLVELLAVITLLSLMLFMVLPLVQSQFQERELEQTAGSLFGMLNLHDNMPSIVENIRQSDHEQERLGI